MRIGSFLGLLAVFSLGCRANPNGSEPGKSAGASTAMSAPANASGSVPASSPSAAASAYPKIGDPRLPKLKPILEKPFPEGASEEVVCEAIDNVGEKDLWARFGHIVPMYLYASVFVLEAKSEQLESVLDVVVDHEGPYWPKVAPCRGSKALVYVRSLAEKVSRNGRSWGRELLAKQLEEVARVKVLESYAFPSDQERLSSYCRADAELCERLVKLDYANGGEGLCPSAIGLLGIYTTDPIYGELAKRCEGLTREAVSCAWYAAGTPEQEACRAQVRSVLVR